MKKLQIRPSQFITTYGVGAIIDGVRGSSIILDFSKSRLFPPDEAPESQYIISLLGASRLSKRIAQLREDINISQIGIFRLPTNADKSLQENQAIYAMNPFPSWSLCHQRHPMGTQILYKRSNQVGTLRGVCPICAQNRLSHVIKDQSNREVIRFIRGCPRGHIDDVNWYYEVHGTFDTKICPEPDYFEYIDAGSELQFVKIRCPNCGQFSTLKHIMNNQLKCSGRIPFYEDPLGVPGRRIERVACDSRTQVIQRTASSVFVPKVITAISLPEEANAFYPILNFLLILPKIRRYLRKHNRAIPFDKILETFEDWALDDATCRSHPQIKEYLRIIRTINSDPKQKDIAEAIIKYFIENIVVSRTPYDEYQLRLDEFNAFREKRESLDIDKSLVFDREIALDYKGVNNTLTFKITPIIQLEAIMIQQGFYRYIKVKKKRRSFTTPSTSDTEEKYEEPKLFETPYIDGQNNYWYVGAKLRGEGIFIELTEDSARSLNYRDEDIKLWDNLRRDIIEFEKIEQKEKGENAKNIQQNNLLSEKEKEWVKTFKMRNFHIFTHPLGVWWHTLSHRLIKALSLDCGYSSAALRERLYIDVDKLIGGALIYASRPGEDGTLGGLVSQSHRFGDILKLALDDIDTCSNDPICLLKNFTKFAVNGAICYACGYLSETSCEFGNIGLDRNTLINTL